MDREGLRRQLEHMLAVRVEKVGALNEARKAARGGTGDRGRSARFDRELQRADEKIASLKNALASLDHIGEQTTSYYVSKRQVSRT